MASNTKFQHVGDKCQKCRRESEFYHRIWIVHTKVADVVDFFFENYTLSLVHSSWKYLITALFQFTGVSLFV